MTEPIYDYESIARWWMDNKATEAKLKKLYPGIDVVRVKVAAGWWRYAEQSPFDWGDFTQGYESPIQLAHWCLHPDNDSPGYVWFRENMRTKRIENEIDYDSVISQFEDTDPEFVERFEFINFAWCGGAGFWLSQIAFYAARIVDRRDFDTDDGKAAA